MAPAGPGPLAQRGDHRGPRGPGPLSQSGDHRGPGPLSQSRAHQRALPVTVVSVHSSVLTPRSASSSGTQGFRPEGEAASSRPLVYG